MTRLLHKLRATGEVMRHVKNWPTMILDHLKMLKGGPVEYRLRNGIRLKCRARTYDVNAVEEVWVMNAYTPPGFELRPTDTVVDVGAHIGCFTSLAALKAHAGRVIAFEPTGDNFARLMDNITLNSFKNVTAVQSAVSGTTGPRQMFLQHNDHVGHSLYPIGSDATATTVDSTTLEQICSEHGLQRIDFLKLDCEGAEFDILLEASDELLAKIYMMSMEVHEGPSRDPGVLRQFLLSKGFSVSVNGSQLYAKRLARP